MSTLLERQARRRRRDFDHTVFFNHAAAPPPQAVLTAMAAAGFNRHPPVRAHGKLRTSRRQRLESAAWDDLPAAERAAKKARQGVPYAALDDLTVMDPETMTRVPADGETLGEVMLRGNVVMKGYLKNPDQRPTRPFAAAGSIPVISVSCTRTDTSNSRTGRRTSSSPAARTSRRSRSRIRSTNTLLYLRVQSWPKPMTNGARHRARSSS